MIKLSAVFMLSLALCGAAFADIWRPAPTERASNDGRFVLKSDIKQRRLCLEEKTATGQLQRWAIPYPEKDSRVPAPVYWHVTEDGNYVVLRDHWGGRGYGEVLIFIGPRGQKLRSYRLEDVLPEAEISEAPHSSSSIHWHQNATFFICESQKQFEVLTLAGTTRVFDLTTGELLSLSSGAVSDIRHRNLQEARSLIRSSDPVARMAGVERLGILRDQQSVDVLKGLLTDESPAGGNDYYEYGVQYSAAEALLRIIGDDAIPLVEGRQSNTGESRRATWRSIVREYREPLMIKARQQREREWAEKHRENHD